MYIKIEAVRAVILWVLTLCSERDQAVQQHRHLIAPAGLRSSIFELCLALLHEVPFIQIITSTVAKEQ